MTRISWLLAVAWLLQTGDSSQVLSAQAGPQSVVLVALDAFHPSYLDRPVSHHLQSLARRGGSGPVAGAGVSHQDVPEFPQHCGSGSAKRVASAVGEGAMAVSFVHAHISTPV